MNSGWYVLGEEEDLFEKEFANYLGVKYSIGVGNGLDALILAFRILGIGSGDQVIVPANTFIASVMGVTVNGGEPVFVEPDENYNIDAAKIEAAITEKTKAILPVHLYGRACDMDQICAIAKKYGLKIVEDCAQAHGTTWKGKKVGTFGEIGCFSFYPTKGLGAFGDGGAIVTDDEAIVDRCKSLHNYGSDKKYEFDEVGVNSRLDEMQAALLRVKLSHLDDLLAERREIAKRFVQGIHHPEIILPEYAESHTWHQFVIRTPHRDALKRYLAEQGVGTEIHYPIPPHLSKAYDYLGYRAGSFPATEQYADEVLSLPIFNGMTADEQTYAIATLNEFTH
jgi:dTDP-4-amino-4,6-dideoxygalactose transaminase